MFFDLKNDKILSSLLIWLKLDLSDLSKIALFIDPRLKEFIS